MALLSDAFAVYNAAYFDGKLPPDTIVSWSRRLASGTAGEFDGDNLIRINAKLKEFRPVWRETLLHEMAHLATHDEEEHHGPKWHKEMRRLYKLGAFTDLL